MSTACDAGIIPADAVVGPSSRFIGDSLTPLFYTPVWRELSPEQKLTYNRISGTYWNELISWFERELALTALAAAGRAPGLRPELSARVAEFAHEEILHAAVFRQLNRISDSARYARGELSVLDIPSMVGRGLAIASNAGAAPALLWVMLLMEERSIAVMDISCRQGIDPLYARVYRAHAADEARHVAIDFELLDLIYATLSPTARQVNARIFGFLLRSFLLRPGRAARRAVALLIGAHPELRPLRRRFYAELHAAGDDRRYRSMMYSPVTTPRTIERLKALPEMQDPLRDLA